MSQLLEYVKMAIKNIKSNKGRSFLTMLGIIIGIGSVIMIMAIGNGVKSDMDEELGAIAGGMVYLYCNTDVEDTYIEPEDMEAITKNINHVSGVSPMDSGSGELNTTKGTFDLNTYFGTESLIYVDNMDIVKGRYLTAADVSSGNLVAVITENDAIKMFGSTDVVGLTVEITCNNVSKDVEIIGVKESAENGTFVTYTYDDMPITFEMPYTTMSQFGYSDDFFTAIYIIAEESQYASAVAQESMDYLISSKNINLDENPYSIQDIASQLDTINSTMSMVTLFITMVAAISLLVGGIGVMNIMLVSVTERTREIGIRKALGAKTGYITLQFLAEAAIITLIGGIIGILLGVGGGNLVSLLSGGLISAKISLSTIAGATLFSSAVGLFFGIYPARRAAKLSPMEALRRT